MLNKIIYSIIFSIIIVGNAKADISNNCGRDCEHHPKQDEILSKSIPIPHCSDVEIVEWRESKVNKELSTYDDKVVEIMGYFCKLTFTAYSKYIEKKFPQYKLTKSKLNLKLSAIPSSYKYDGKEFRNLNDNKFRFSKFKFDKEKFYSGYYIDKDRHIYIGSEIYNYDSETNRKYFRFEFFRSFMHELIHAQNQRFGVMEELFDNSSELEEKFTSEVTAFLERFIRDKGIIQK